MAAVEQEDFVVIERDNAVEVGEFAIHYLADDDCAVATETDLIEARRLPRSSPDARWC